MNEQQLQAIFNLLQDVLGSAVFKFNLTDSWQGNILHIGSDSPHFLTLTIKNKTRQRVTIKGLSGEPSKINCDFSIKFINNNFWFDSPPTVASSDGWKAKVNSDKNYSDQIFLLTTKDITLQPNGQENRTLA